MADLRFADAVWGDLVRYLGQVVAIYLVTRVSTLNLNITFVIMGIAATAATVVQALQIGLAPLRLIQLRVIAMRFWRLGRWMLLTNATGIVTALGFWWVLRWTHGPEECAVFGAIVTLFKLANPVMSSMSGLIMPAVARAQEDEGSAAARRQALRYTAVGAVMLAPYFLFLGIAPGLSLRIFYGADSPYVSSATWLALFVANYSVAYLSTTTSAWLAGLGRSRDTFIAQAVGVAATLLVGLPVTAMWGVGGLVLGGLFSTAAATATTLHLIRRAPLQPSPGSAVSS